MRGNSRLENVPPSLELVRISNHALKGMIEANIWKNRNKLFQSSEINHESCGMMSQNQLIFFSDVFKV